MKVLWLASWYPSAIEPFNGDFIQRHAQAVSVFHDIDVLHVIKDDKGSLTRNVKVVNQKKGKLAETIVYYFHLLQKLPFLGRFFSELKYRSVFQQQIKIYIQKNGKPDVVHLHVSMRAGIVALWLQKKYGIPYVLTEHSSIFLPEADVKFSDLSRYYRRSIQKVIKGAAAITVVSKHLRSALKAFVPGKKIEVIPNVVNTEIFMPAAKSHGPVLRFVHASSLDANKNPEGILAAFAILKNTLPTFSLDIFGPQNLRLQNMVAALGLQELVKLHGEVAQPVLAEYMQRADALILFSRYETFGCVVIEASACGTPVIVSKIPAMEEIVKEGFNGLVVQRTPEALASALQRLAENEIVFNSAAIAAQAKERFSYATVSAAFSAFYRSVYQNR